MLSLFLSADSSAGRFDVSMLSAQTLMELLIKTSMLMPSSKIAQDAVDADFPQVTDLDGVVCDQNGAVTQIRWHNSSQNGFESTKDGTFEFRYLPRTLQQLNLEGMRCPNALDFSDLPDSLERFSIEGCSFTGSIDLTALPSSLKKFEITEWAMLARRSAFTGRADLTRLPDPLRVLLLEYTGMSGPIDLEHLNQNMTKLYLGHNFFDGTISLQSLPASLRHLRLDCNRFHGEIDVSGVPETLRTLCIAGNDAIFGVIDLNMVHPGLDIKYALSRSAKPESLVVIPRLEMK